MTRLIVFVLFLFVTSGLYCQTAEICANGSDDDGDSLIDCDDPDCFQPFFTDNSFGGSDSRGVEAGDVDGDGDLDLFVGNFGQPNLVWINQGGIQGGALGDFLESGQALGASNSRAVDLGDVDNDGDLDVFVANYGGPNHLWVNQGGSQGGSPGVFEQSGQAMGDSLSHAVELGDVDGDGDLDAWVANANNQPNQLWINQGGTQGGVLGVFGNSGQTLSGSNSRGVSLGDIDGDGDLDAFISNWGPNQIWINQGGDQGGLEGSYSVNAQLLGNSQSTGVSLGDIDNDGDLDAWFANSSNQVDAIWINQGFSQGGVIGEYEISSQNLGTSASAAVSFGDLDNDGDVDVWISNDVGQPNNVWFNQGGQQNGVIGSFTISGSEYGSSSTYSSVLGDFNGDGFLDACSANVGSSPNQFWINNLGAENCTSPEDCGNQVDDNSDGLVDCADPSCLRGVGYEKYTELLGSSVRYAYGDLDDDGDLDLVGNNGEVFLNFGGIQGGDTGAFMEGDSLGGVGFDNASNVVVGDIDGDGDLDIIILHRFVDARIFINSGYNSALAQVEFEERSGLSDGDFLSIGDLDGDGDLDALISDQNGIDEVWINLGGDQAGDEGYFINSGQELVNSELGTLYSGVNHLVDLDLDGDLDAIILGYLNAGSYAWYNQGGSQGGAPGVFKKEIGNGFTVGGSCAVGDVDLDGDSDVVVVRSADFGYGIYVHLNLGGIQSGLLGIVGPPIGEYGSASQDNYRDVELADHDGDGDLDMFVVGDNTNHIFENQGGIQGGVAGEFLQSALNLGDLQSAYIRIFDSDKDGDVDALITSFSGANPYELWRNNGSVYCNSDSDGDGISDECDVDNTSGPDCDLNGQDDSCQLDFDQDGIVNPCDNDYDGDGVSNLCEVLPLTPDCNDNGIADWCDLQNGFEQDCNLNGIPDSCDIDSQTSLDCNQNAIPDSCDLAAGVEFDCDLDGVPDSCKSGQVFDCNLNGIPDECEFLSGTAVDCNGNGSLDDCDLANGYEFDCDSNGQLDICDIEAGAADCNLDSVPDSCQSDSDSDGTIDLCDDDLDGDGILNACDVDQTAGEDCDLNGQDDSCQGDQDSDGEIDPCDADIDGDGIPNSCDLDLTSGADCDQDGQDDSCQPDGDADGEIDPCDPDLDNDGILNACDPDHSMGEDCNSNGILDSCDISGGSEDNDSNGIPDECEETQFIRGDVNGDSGIDISDAITVLGYLFTGGSIDCEKAADSNDDGAVNVADGIQILGYLFSGTGDPPAPFPDCGGDPTVDLLGCEAYGGCP